MPAFNQMNRRERVNQAEDRMQRRLREARQHNLTPLAELLGMDVHDPNLPQPRFQNLSGTADDYIGSDLRLIAGENQWDIQDKFRTSLQGSDLGIEFCRMFLYKDNQIVLDGGRDIFRQFPKKVEFTYEQGLGIRRARRNWPGTKTQCDLFLLHTKNDPDFIWMLAEPAKNIARLMFATWLKKFSEIEAEVEVEVFGKGRTMTYNTLLDSDFDIKCLKEKRENERKKVEGPDGEVVKAYIAKTIVYIPFSTFTEGTEWVRTTRS